MMHPQQRMQYDNWLRATQQRDGSGGNKMPPPPPNMPPGELTCLLTLFFCMHDMTLGLKFVGAVLDCCWECSVEFHNFILRNNYQIIYYSQKIKRNSFLQTEQRLEKSCTCT